MTSYWTPQSVEWNKNYGGGLMKAGTDASPVGHWTQALARVLQGGVGGYMVGQANEGERAGKQAVADIYRQGLAAGKPMSAIAASLMGNPFGADQGQALAKQHMVTAQNQGFQREQQDRQFKQQMQLQGGSQAHAMKMQTMQQQFQLRLMQAKSDMERQQLLEKAKALGLMPDGVASPSAPIQDGYIQHDPRMPSSAPAATASPASQPAGQPPSFVPPGTNLAPPTDPYERITQPAISPEAEAADRKKRAAQTLIAGDTKGALKILNKDEDPKEYQTKDALFSERMARSEVGLRGILQNYSGMLGQKGPQSTMNAGWFDDSLFNSSSWRQYQGAAREWISALLRKDTGAAVTETEWKLYFPTFFPIPGDSEAVVQDKLRRRVAAAQGLRGSSGPAFNKMYPGFDQEMRNQLAVQNQAKGGARASGPAIGTVDQGYRFKGGDPSKPESWEPVR